MENEMTLEKFRETKKKMRIHEYCEMKDEDAELFSNPNDSVFVYDDNYWIEECETSEPLDSGAEIYYSTVIGAEYYEDESLEEIEKILFETFY